LRAIGYGDFQPVAAVIGDRFLFVGHGVSVVGPRLTGRPRRFAHTSGFFPAADTAHVWLLTSHGQNHFIRRESLKTGAADRSIELPRSTVLVQGTKAGLLLENYKARGAPLELWNPGGAPSLLPHSPSWADGFTATPRLIAYGTDCRGLSPAAETDPDACGVLRVLDVVTGRVASYPSPPRTLGWVPFEFNLVDAISKSSTHLAAVAAISPRHADRGRLYTVPLTSSSGEPTAVPGSAGSVRSRVAWSARGNWLFYQGPTRTLQAYQVSTGRMRTSSTPCCQYTVMAAVPSSH
jgi:hypothetical protein